MFRRQKPQASWVPEVYLRSKNNKRRGPGREPHDRRHCTLLCRVCLNVRIVGCNRLLQRYLGFYVGQERELETVYWGSGLDSLVFSARDDAVVFETNVEAFIRVGSSKSTPETETDLVPFNCMYEPRVPLPSLDCSHRLDEDLVADQHAGALLRQTRDGEASKPINFLPLWGAKIRTNGRAVGIQV